MLLSEEKKNVYVITQIFSHIPSGKVMERREFKAKSGGYLSALEDWCNINSYAQNRREEIGTVNVRENLYFWWYDNDGKRYALDCKCYDK